MKLNYLFFYLLTGAGLISSCSNSCDASTAEGAAKCTCELIKAFDDAKGDEERTREVNDRYDRFQSEMDRHINDGTYTEQDVNQAILKLDNCK